jgi:hypothetical protein
VQSFAAVVPEHAPARSPRRLAVAALCGLGGICEGLDCNGQSFHRMRQESGWARQWWRILACPRRRCSQPGRALAASSSSLAQPAAAHTRRPPAATHRSLLHLVDRAALSLRSLTSPLPSPGAEPRTVTVSHERAAFFLVATQRSHPRHAPPRPQHPAPTTSADTWTPPGCVPGRPLCVRLHLLQASLGCPVAVARFRALLFSRSRRALLPATARSRLPTPTPRLTPRAPQAIYSLRPRPAHVAPAHRVKRVWLPPCLSTTVFFRIPAVCLDCCQRKPPSLHALALCA